MHVPCLDLLVIAARKARASIGSRTDASWSATYMQSKPSLSVSSANFWSCFKSKGFSLKTALAWEHAVDFVVVCIVSLVVLLLRWRQRLSMVAATLIVYSAALAISSHVFPWYTTTLLPWIAVLIGPLWTG